MIATVGLIGTPIAQSLSPAMHNAAFRHHGIAESYALWDTETAGLAERMEWLRFAPVRGANITIPHKQAALALVDQLDATATVVGAINTIVRVGEALHATNTDVGGFIAALNAIDQDPAGRTIVVLGAGGAARGVVYGLLQTGAARLVVANRTPERAEALLADMLAAIDTDPVLEAMALDDPALAATIGEATMIVNTTSVGTNGTSVPLDPALLQSRHAVIDIIYRDTPLLRAARAIGAQTQNGLEMLVQQGALAFEAWTGLQAPRAVMRAAAREAMDKQT